MVNEELYEEDKEETNYSKTVKAMKFKSNDDLPINLKTEFDSKFFYPKSKGSLRKAKSTQISFYSTSMDPVREVKEELDNISETMLQSPRIKFPTDFTEDNTLLPKSCFTSGGFHVSKNYSLTDDDVIEEDNNENLVEVERPSRKKDSMHKLIESFVDKEEDSNFPMPNNELNLDNNEINFEPIEEEKAELDDEEFHYNIKNKSSNIF